MSVGSRLAPWRFAARLARREVRRHPGRTILVALLVAIPIVGMTVFSVLVRTTNSDSQFEGYPAGTDIVVAGSDALTADLDGRIPEGATTSSAVWADWVPIETASGRTINGITLGDPAYEDVGILSTSMGQSPRDGEVWLSTSLADDLGVDVGDTLELRHPEGSWTVAGTGRSSRNFDRRIMVMAELPIDQFDVGILNRRVLIDLPPGTSERDLNAVGNALSNSVPSSTSWVMFRNTSLDDAASLAWGWVGGAIVLAAAGIVIAAAFATSARRQLVTIGLLSSNGASDQVMKRTLALQGFWTGLAGSLGGFAVAIVGLLAGHSTVENISNKALDYRFALADFLIVVLTGTAAATVAALIPARSASRVPVMAALAGRRPVGAVPRRLVPRGVGLFVIGCVLLSLGAAQRGNGNLAAIAAVVGGVAVLAGVSCCTPLAVEGMSRASARLGGSWRFAGRSLARTRTRTAAVVTATAVTGALAVAGSTAASRLDTGADYQQWPDDAVVLYPSSEVAATEALEEMGIDLSAAVADIVPNATWYERRVAVWDHGVGQEGFDPFEGQDMVVADEAMIDLYDLSRVERDALDNTGALVLNSWYPEGIFDSTKPSLTIPTVDRDVSLPVALRDHVAADFQAMMGFGYAGEAIYVAGNDLVMITEGAAAAAGFEIVTEGGFARTPAALTSAQRSAIDQAAYGGEPNWLADYYRDVRQTQFITWSVSYQWPGNDSHTTQWQLAIAGLALLLTLLVVGIALSLAAAESRDERDVLVALGGRQRTMRNLAGVKAVAITLTGVALAIPTGLVPAVVALRATDVRFEIPWLTIGALLIVVPLVACSSAWIVSNIAQRIRPVRLSTLAFD